MQVPMVAAARLLLSSPAAEEIFRFENSLIVIINPDAWKAYRDRRGKLQPQEPLTQLTQALTHIEIDVEWFCEISRLPDGTHPRVFLVPAFWQKRGHPVDRPPYGLPKGATHRATRFDPSQLKFVQALNPKTQQAAEALLNISGSRRSRTYLQVGRPGRQV